LPEILVHFPETQADEKPLSMRLLLITSSYPDADEGQAAAGSFVADFARALTQQDISVTVLAPGLKGHITTEQGIKVHRFPVPRLPLALLNPKSPPDWPAILKTMTFGRRMAVQAAQEEKIEHILAFWVLPSGWWAMRAANRQNIGFSTWALGSDIWSLGKLPLVKNILKSLLRKSRHRFADGYRLADDVKKLSGLDCTFLPSARKLPIKSEKVLSTAPPYKLAYLGRWHPHKGTDLLLAALQLLKDSQWEKIGSVEICGGGPLEELVRQQCERLIRNGRPVTVRSYLNREEATDLLMWADYLLLPSRIESIPVIFSDALQTNCPLVAMPVGDLPRLMEDCSVGFLASSVTAEGLKTAIEQALAGAPVNFATGLRALRARFEVTHAADRFLEQIL
jgi:glycosyltransferase involved in cell wall biosynthesis